MTTSWIPLINICYSPFLRVFIHLKIFHSVSIFDGFIPFVVVILLHEFINLHVWLLLIHFLLSKLLGRDPQMLHWLKGWFYLICVWCVTVWPLSTNFSLTPISHMHPFGQKQDIAASVHSYYLKHYLWWFIRDIIIPNACFSGSDVLNNFRISFLCKFGTLVYVSYSSY